MVTRTNANILADPYSNTSSFMSPKGTVQSTNKLVTKLNSMGDPNKIKQDAIYAADAGKKKLPEWEKPEFSISNSLATSPELTATAVSQGTQMAKTMGSLADASKLMKSAKVAGATAQVTGVGGDAAAKSLDAAKKASSAAKGALGGLGVSLGATAGKMALNTLGDKKLSEAGMDQNKYMKAQWMKGIANDNLVSSLKTCYKGWIPTISSFILLPNNFIISKIIKNKIYFFYVS